MIRISKKDGSTVETWLYSYDKATDLWQGGGTFFIGGTEESAAGYVDADGPLPRQSFDASEVTGIIEIDDEVSA
jgi:hypothetical protein